ncbi:hypothetical protein B0H13DRAFT_156982 [Mycena leptocephala]|nr:hypothetical protein B0H13DRAFT_156982 [Mycena leptocephala]
MDEFAAAIVWLKQVFTCRARLRLLPLRRRRRLERARIHRRRAAHPPGSYTEAQRWGLPVLCDERDEHDEHRTHTTTALAHRDYAGVHLRAQWAGYSHSRVLRSRSASYDDRQRGYDERGDGGMREDMQRGAEERSWWTEKDGEQGHGVHGSYVPILSLFPFEATARGGASPAEEGAPANRAFISFLGLLPSILFGPSFFLLSFRSSALFLSYMLNKYRRSPALAPPAPVSRKTRRSALGPSRAASRHSWLYHGQYLRAKRKHSRSASYDHSHTLLTSRVQPLTTENKTRLGRPL